jgi:hypothetical protein
MGKAFAHKAEVRVDVSLAEIEQQRSDAAKVNQRIAALLNRHADDSGISDEHHIDRHAASSSRI